MIELNNISKAFGNKIIFENYSLVIDDGDFIVVTGESGCGKTTLLNIIGSLESVDSGNVVADGLDISKKSNQTEYLKNQVGFLFKNFALVDNKTVSKNLDIVKKSCRSKVSIDQALEAVGLSDKKEQKVYSLSGGEQQRIALARLMVKKCKYIIADEPTGSLDRKNAQIVISILKKFNEEGKTIILATHDEDLKNVGGRLISL